jgi:2-polyprenyl-6-methoxyphenol hydroxylase-like FAD-dependent oxidoreductase
VKMEVLVAGAGPVGLAMAAELTRYGVSVRIVEKNAHRTDKSKALVIWSRTLELMDRMGCSDRFLPAGLRVTGANVTSGSKQIGHIALGGAATPYPFALMIPQSETERLLEEFLNKLGVEVERTVELAEFTASANEVSAKLRHADGREETVEASWLIGCDGAHSIVRHQLGMEFQGDTLMSDWMLADVHLSGVPVPGEVSVIWHSDGVLVIFPITASRYRVIADIGPTDAGQPRPDPTLEEVQGVLDRRGPGGIEASAPVWLANFHINERKVADYQSGRVFLAGDAAHIHSPAGGQGMNTGIQDACNLAWKLALVSHGTCAASPLLDSYSPERSAVGDQVLKGAGRLTAVATMKGAIKQSIRNHIASLVFGIASVRDAAANAMEEISIGYPEGPLNAVSTHTGLHPRPGERAPIRKGESPVGAGNRPRFVLFGSGDSRFSQVIAQYPDLVEPDLREPFDEGGLWLVRPDGYVALATKRGGWDEIAGYLRRIVGPTRLSQPG